jgi:hypothetical protein
MRKSELGDYRNELKLLYNCETVYLVTISK